MGKRKKKRKEKRREEEKNEKERYRDIVLNRMKFAIGFGHPIDRGIDLIDRGIEIEQIAVEKMFSRKEAKSRARRRKIVRAQFPHANL